MKRKIQIKRKKMKRKEMKRKEKVKNKKNWSEINNLPCLIILGWTVASNCRGHMTPTLELFWAVVLMPSFNFQKQSPTPKQWQCNNEFEHKPIFKQLNGEGVTKLNSKTWYFQVNWVKRLRNGQVMMFWIQHERVETWNFKYVAKYLRKDILLALLGTSLG